LWICILVVVGIVAWSTWQYAVPAIRLQVARHAAARYMASIDTIAAPPSGATMTADQLSKISDQISSLLQLPQPVFGRREMLRTSSRVIHAGQIVDASGKLWTVLVFGGGEQVSTLAWPSRSDDPRSISWSFAFSMGHGIAPSRIAFPASQPASRTTTLPIELLVDGAPQHASLSIDATGRTHGNLEGLQNRDVMGSGMVWGEVGRLGYRNVDLTIPPAKSFPHAARTAVMRFTSDGRLAAVSQGLLEIIDPTSGASSVIDRPQDKSRTMFHYRLSHDGRRFIIPYSQKLPPLVVEMGTGMEHALPLDVSAFWGSSDIGFSSPEYVLTTNHGQLFRVNVDTGLIETFDLVKAPDGGLEIRPHDSALAPVSGGGSSPNFCANAGKMVIVHESGTFLFSEEKSRWGKAKRVGAAGIGYVSYVSLSPNGQWLASANGSAATIIDLENLHPVFETYAQSLTHEIENVSWSDDGTMAVMAPAGQPLLCLLGREKLAIRIVLPTQNTAVPFHGAFCLSHDGAQLAVADTNAGQLLIWRTADLLAAAHSPSH
jgi:hypothetical protein